MIYQSFSKRQNLTLTWWNRPKYKGYDGIICDGSIRSGKTVSMTDGFILWSMSSFNGQNFAICGKTIESLRRNVVTLMPQWLEGMYSGVFYRRYILGLWVKAEGLVYPMFDRSAHIVRNIPAFSPRHRYYVAVDYGTVNPFAAGLYDYSPAEQKAVMIKELYYKGGSNNRVDNEAY